MFALIDILFVVTCFVCIIAGYSISAWVIRGISEIEADNNELRMQISKEQIKNQQLQSQLSDLKASIKEVEHNTTINIKMHTGQIEYLNNQIAMINHEKK